jgi:tetratricopeptide (TPR) repeat protein
LTNPRNDAADVAAALKMHGFQVIEGLDLEKVALDRKIRDFARALEGAVVGLFFYAGHGLQVSGSNYIIPVDAEVATESALDFETVRLDLVQRTMERAAATNILIVDACRNNPFTRNLARAMGTRSTQIGRGLAPVEAGIGTLISFSTQPGAVADDGIGRRNSPFTGALVKHLLSSNEEIMPLLREVRVEVIRETNRRQVPWEHTALTSGFYFKTGANPPPPPSIPNPVLPALAAPQMNASDLERSRVAFNQGKAAYERKDFDRAIPDFTETIRLEPNNSEGFYNRGLAYAQKGDFDSAIADFNETIRLAPKFANGFYNRGLAYSRKNEFDKAIADFSEVIRLEPKAWGGFRSRGTAYYFKNDFDKAIADYNEALRLDANNPWALYLRGKAKQRSGDKSGDADIDKARQLDPSVGM